MGLGSSPFCADPKVMELRLKDSPREREVRPIMNGDPASHTSPMHVTADEIALHKRRSSPYSRRGVHTIQSRSWRLRTRIGAWIPSAGRILAAVLIAGGAWIVTHLERSTPANAQQTTAVLTGQDVAHWTGAFTYDPALETLAVTRRLFGPESITCHYDSGGEDPITLTCRAVLHATEEDAATAFSFARVHLLMDFRLDRRGEVGLIETHDAHHWGDEVRAFQVTEGQTPIGHSFVARKGRRTFYVALQGVVVQPEWSFAGLLVPRLRAFEDCAFDEP